MTPRRQTRLFAAWRPILIGLLGLGVLLGGFGYWSVTAEIAGAVVASGQVEVDQSRQVVQHPDGGVVEEILVEEGDTVGAGDVLVRLDPSFLASELAILDAQLYEILARRARLEAERDLREELLFSDALLARAGTDGEIADLVLGQRRLFTARREMAARETEQLGQRKIQIDNQIDGIEAERVALDEQIVLLEDELEDKLTLQERGLMQASVVTALQREAAALKGEKGQLTAALGEARERLTEIDIEITKIDVARVEEAIAELRDIRQRQLEVEERRRALQEQLSRLDVRAPVSGVVYGLSVFAPRSVIRAAEPVLFLIPQDRPLVIAARVNPIDVDEVFASQVAMLRFAALDSRTTPELRGRVTQISADAFTDEQTQATYFRAEIELSEAELDKLPAGATVVPGMPVDAFLETQRRTPLSYFTKPLAEYFQRAFRET